VSIHAFADDTQLYRHCFHDKMAATVVRLERCLKEVSHWMSANHLKLNADKMELLWVGSKYSQPSLGSKGLPLQIDSVLSQRPTTFACLALPSLLILAWTNMFPAYVHHVSSGYANFDDHRTTSP